MTVLGPNFSQLDEISMRLSGSSFCVSLPPHSHPRSPKLVSRERDLNIYDARKFSVHGNSREGGPRYYGLLTYIWSYYERKFGLFSSDAGKCYLEASIFHMPEFSSLFKSERVNSAIERMIFCHGDAYTSSGLARLNWRIEDHNGTAWLAFENDGQYSSAGLYNPCKAVIQSFYITPLSDEHMLSLCFTQVHRKEVPGLERAFSTLCEHVLSSTQINLSEDAVRQKREALGAHTEPAYSQTLPPYEYELMHSPQRSDISERCGIEYGIDDFIALPYEARSKIVNRELSAENEKRQQQLDAILASHLRFKENK